MKIIEYKDEYKDEAIKLILHIQNDEARINLSLDEQPDLKDITGYYNHNGGGFWIALNDENHVIGTIALMRLNDGWGVLKKFSVRSDYRSQHVGLALYQTLIEFARAHEFRHIILDTPSVAEKSHRFYKSAGFREIAKENLQVAYTYPDRDSLLFHLDL